jgi:hypothetical protein
MPEGVGYGPQDTASIGLNLNVIGSHAYAYAISESAATSSDTRLSFETGNYYLVGRFTGNASTDPTGLDNGNITAWSINFNGLLVAQFKVESAGEDSPMLGYNDIIIPPYTKVVVLSRSDGDSAGRITTCMITGRIYK